MNNIYFFLICLFFISNPLSADEMGLQELCQPYTEEPPALNIDYHNYPYTEGLTWKISKDGKTNYIYGSIHTQDRRATRFPPQVRLGIYQSKRYLMEIKLSQESNNIFQNAMFYKKSETLEDKLNPVFINVLGNQLSHYGYKKEDAKRIKPWAAFSTIGSPKPIRAYSLDQILMNYANSRGAEIIGIESMHDLVESLASINEADQITILKDTICNRTKIIRQTWDLVQMHMRDDLLGLVKFNEQPHHNESVFQRYMQTMVYDRNQRMLERILPYFKQGSSFAAIGALHLPGEKGLLKLLVDEGFTVENLK